MLLSKLKYIREGFTDVFRCVRNGFQKFYRTGTSLGGNDTVSKQELIIKDWLALHKMDDIFYVERQPCQCLNAVNVIIVDGTIVDVKKKICSCGSKTFIFKDASHHLR